MSNRTYFSERLWQQQPVKHAPSPIELMALERELQEAVAYFRLRCEQYVLPPALASSLLTLATNGCAALEQLAPSLSEARDRVEHTR